MLPARFRIAFATLALMTVALECANAQTAENGGEAARATHSFGSGTIAFDAFDRWRAARKPVTPLARALWPFSRLDRVVRSARDLRRGPRDTATTPSCPYPDGCGGADTGGGIPAYGIALIIAGAGGLTYVLVHHPHHDVSPTPFPATTSREATPQPAASASPAAAATAAPGPHTTSNPGGAVTTTSAPTEAPSVAPTVGPSPPQYTPQPSATPTIVPCRTWQTEGYLEPVQGTWQDDPTFDDRSGAQITEIKPFTYEAELPMIAFRDTLLYGIDHYEKNGERQSAPGHFTIVIRGKSTCSKTKLLHFRFWIRDGAGAPVNLGDYIDQKIPMTGPPLPNDQKSDWSAYVGTEKGWPFNRTFKLSSPSGYHAWGELLDAHDDPSGFRVDVFGKTVFTAFPGVLVQPLFISADSSDPKGFANDVASMTSYGRVIADELNEYGSDALPVKLGTVRASSRPTTFLALTSHFSFTKQSEVVSRLTSRLTALGALSKYGRVVVILRDDDFSEFDPLSFLEYVSKGRVVGIAIDAKVILMREYSGWDTGFHELLHTLPYLWSTGQMKSECSRDYHNGADDGVANGVRVYEGGKLGRREWVDHKTAILGKGDDGFSIAQCTYAHLASQLQKNSDPKTFFIRATVRENGGTTFDPFYTTDGFIDAPAPRGSWAAIVRDGGGRELRRAAFTPNWEEPSVRVPRDAQEVSFRFPYDPGAASVEIRAHGRLVARRAIAAAPPAVSIDSPTGGASIGRATTLLVRWHATGSTSTPLLATVRVSSDGGVHYDVQAFEIHGSSFTVRLDPRAKESRVNVIVTNGTRSVESEAVVRR